MGLGINISVSAGNLCLNKVSAVTSAPPAQTEPVTKDTDNKASNTQSQLQIPISPVNPVAVVKNPGAYLHKKVQITARFNKFATIGLDYKPAFRSSETYISFLIFRTDTDKNIPLSEMKLFLTRKQAEKFIDLKEGDIVQFTGTVFSNALGDAWIDVETLSKISKQEKK